MYNMSILELYTCFTALYTTTFCTVILSTTEEPETNVAGSFDGSGVVAVAVSSTIPQSVINYWTKLNAKAA